jgi:hypothetical protein
MPAKSKHGKGKHPHQSRRSKAIQRQASSAIKQSAVAETQLPTASIDITPVPKVRTESAIVKTMQYPFIVNELRRIGILAGIILVVLVILAIILT